MHIGKSENSNVKMPIKNNEYFNSASQTMGKLNDKIEEAKIQFKDAWDGVLKKLPVYTNKLLADAKNGRYIYHKLSELGSGAFGKVYLAGCLENDDIVALKVIQKAKLSKADQNESLSLVSEIEIMSLCKNSFIIVKKDDIIRTIKPSPF